MPGIQMPGTAPVATPEDAGFLEETLPNRPHRDIDPYEDTDYVLEGSEEAAALAAPELAGKSRAEIMAELQKAQEAITAEKARADPVAALTETLSKMLPQQAKPAPAPLGYTVVPQVGPAANPYANETPEQRKARINDLWLSDPEAAARATYSEQQNQLAALVATNQAQMSREILLANPETKKLYDRFSDEIETEVAKMPPVERFQNPRMYQTALERVKYRHQDEFIAETLEAKVEEAVNARLAAMGLGAPGKAAAPTAPAQRPTYSGVAGPGQRPPQARSTIVIPAWVQEEADRKGVDPKFYYNHLKSKGQL